MEFMGKVPPHSIEAEESVLGAMILDKDAITEVTDIIKDVDFYREAHKEIFGAIIELYNKNQPVDLVTVSDQLITIGKLEETGGIEYLADLTSAGVVTTNARYYAKIIDEKSTLRRLIRASSEIIESGYETQDAALVLDQAEKTIFDISQKQNKEGMTAIKEVLVNAYDEIERMYEHEGGLTGITTGFIDLDMKTSGFQRSDMILVAARPSMGKTAFSLNLCHNAALKGDGCVAIFSLEMSKEQLVQRLLSSESHIPLGKIRNGELEEQDWIDLTKGMSTLSNAKIFIDDTPAVTVMEVRAKCRRLKMEHGLDMVMIDYLQLMSGNAESRQQEISNISRGLKGLAREVDCPVVALSQLSRAPELRADHRPILSDLRESGAIEQDADVVMFLYRDEYYFPESEKKGIGELIIAKQRNGETGTVELTWLGQYTKFVNLEREYVDG